MRVVTSKELSTFKILPFDLYNEANAKILPAGEVLTPGKLIMLKNYPKVYTEDFNTETIKGKHILLIDDVITTGATLDACAQTLLSVPNVKVSIATLAYAGD